VIGRKGRIRKGKRMGLSRRGKMRVREIGRIAERRTSNRMNSN
jgi:hypothetical protein